MKVLFVIDTLEVGGTERSILEITRRFQQLKVAVVPLFKGETLKPDFEASGVPVFSLNLSSPYSVYRCWRAVRSTFLDLKPDVVVASLFFSEFYSRIAATGTRIKLVGTFVNDSYSRERYKGLSTLARWKLMGYQLLDAITARRCNAFLANSRSIAESNARSLWLEKSRVSVIHRGRSPKPFVKPHSGSASGTCFVSIGRLIERKGHEELITAFSRLLIDHPEARLRIAGNGYLRPELERGVRKKGLEARIELLGHVEDVPSLLYDSDYFVMCSHYEGFSGALIEAMLSGIPIIATDIAMTREAIVHMKEGYLYPVRDEDALWNAMDFMLTSREAALRMGSNARERALRDFNIERISSDTERFLLSFAN